MESLAKDAQGGSQHNVHHGISEHWWMQSLKAAASVEKDHVPTWHLESYCQSPAPGETVSSLEVSLLINGAIYAHYVKWNPKRRPTYFLLQCSKLNIYKQYCYTVAMPQSCFTGSNVIPTARCYRLTVTYILKAVLPAPIYWPLLHSYNLALLRLH